MARYSRQRYQRIIVAAKDSLTTSQDMNVAGLSSALALCSEIVADYSAHISDTDEHKELHVAAQLATTVAPLNLTQLLAAVNDLTTKYTLHNADAIVAVPTYHQAQSTTNALAATTTVTTLAGAITRLNDFKAKFNSHDGNTTSHTTGSKYQIAAANAAFGVEIFCPEEDVKIGDKVFWSILDNGTADVTGVSATVADGGVVFKFSANPVDSTIISYAVVSGGL